MALDDIYKEVILDHYKNPRNKREMPDAELSCSRNNPLCGDEITVFVHADGDVVCEVSFVGQGCSISQSSASLMTEAVTGRSVADAEALIHDFRQMMVGDLDGESKGMNLGYQGLSQRVSASPRTVGALRLAQAGCFFVRCRSLFSPKRS